MVLLMVLLNRRSEKLMFQSTCLEFGNKCNYWKLMFSIWSLFFIFVGSKKRGNIRHIKVVEYQTCAQRCSTSFNENFKRSTFKLFRPVFDTLAISFQSWWWFFPKDKLGNTILTNDNYTETWKEMEKLVQDGLVRSVGKKEIFDNI